MPIRRHAGSVLLAAVALGLVAAWVAPATARGDEPARGQLLVAGDHHLPGAAFEITGSGLDPGDVMRFTLMTGATSVDLGNATVAADGTISSAAVVPSTFLLGYAEVIGTTPGGTQLRTVVLIGERAEGPASQPAQDEWPPERIAGVALVGIGLVLVVLLGAVHVRGRGDGRPAST